MTVRPAKPKRPRVAEERATTPRHVAVIMDGNGRWAKQHGVSRQAGHRAGTENIRRIIQTFAERRIDYLTLFAFSTENWRRPKREINPLLKLIGRVIDRELKTLHENNVRLLHIGVLDPLPGDLQRRVRDAIEMTKDNTGLTVCVAFNYGGRAEIVDAVKALVAEGVRADEIDETRFASYLNTAGIPDPDLVIRTSGEVRLSNFLIWQTAYAEFYFTPLYWPDFDEDEVARALDAYAGRIRRFGGLNGSNGHKNGASNGAHP